MDQTQPPVRLSRKRAAMYIEAVFGIPMSTSKLSKIACSGNGPPYELFGVHPVYLPSNIDSWAAAQIGPLVRRLSIAQPPIHQRTIAKGDQAGLPAAFLSGLIGRQTIHDPDKRNPARGGRSRAR
jgi:hypothetical protein